MFTVYALHSPKHDKIYIGYTSNLEQRLLSHNKLGTKGWTIKYRPWEVVYTEEHETKSEFWIKIGRIDCNFFII